MEKELGLVLYGFIAGYLTASRCTDDGLMDVRDALATKKGKAYIRKALLTAVKDGLDPDKASQSLGFYYLGRKWRA